MKPYYNHAGIQIINAHVLDALKDMESESIQCCVTSPPYWGLRDYGLKPQIWDAVEGCDHIWGPEMLSPEKHGHTGIKAAADRSSPRKNPRVNNRYEDGSINQGNNNGAFCQICGAWKGSLGLEPTPELYIQHMTEIFREVKRVLKKDGTCWLNLGDSYAGSGRGNNPNGKQSTNKGTMFDCNNPGFVPIGLKPKDLIGIPWRVALSLQSDGWWLRSDIIWNKPNPMPESVTDRPTKAHEYIFLLTKSSKYYYDHEAVKEPVAKSTIGRGPVDFGGKKGRDYTPDKDDPNYRGGNEQWGRTFDYKESCKNGRNKRSVWTIATQPFPEAHFAVFPVKLIEPCILAGTKIGDTVLDPFGGSGTTVKVSKRLNRKAIAIELNPEYAEMPVKHLVQEVFSFGTIKTN